MLILASESPRRRELLTRLGIPFEVESAQVDEVSTRTSPRDVPPFNAELKAAAVAVRHPDAVVLGADTVILLGDRVIGKPRNADDALNTLLALAGRTHEVITGIALVSLSHSIRRVWSEITRVTFKPFSRDVACRYLADVYVLDKAGAYAIQEHGDLIVDSIDGSLENVVGLPLERLRIELSSLIQ